VRKASHDYNRVTSVFDIAAVGQGILFLVSLLESLLSAFAGGGAGQARLPALSFLGLPFGLALTTRKIAPVALHLGATLCHLRERPLARRL